MHTPIGHQAASIIPEPSKVEVKSILIEGSFRGGTEPELVVHTSGRLAIGHFGHGLHPALVSPDFYKSDFSEHARPDDLERFAIVWAAALPLSRMNSLAGLYMRLNHTTALLD